MTGRRLGLALALVASLAGAASAAEPVRIGLGAPLSGPDAIFGDQLRLGVDQAATDINASGGILGHRLKVVPGNDSAEAKKGLEVAKGFVATGVDLVIGHFSSAVTVPASAIYAEAGVLDITPSATAPLVTERGLATVFRMCAREDRQAEAAVKFLQARRYGKIALVHDRSPAGKAFIDAVRKQMADAGQQESFYGSVAPDARDASGLAGRVRTSGAQIVVWGGAPAGAATLARQLQTPHIPLLGGLSIASDDFASLAGGAADGNFVVFPRDPRKLPAATDLLHRLQADDDDPYGYVFYAYAAVQVIKQAAEATQSLDPKTLAAKMHSGLTFQTVLGPIAFDANGDPTTSDLTVYVWHKGPTGRMGFADPAAS